MQPYAYLYFSSAAPHALPFLPVPESVFLPQWLTLVDAAPLLSALVSSVRTQNVQGCKWRIQVFSFVALQV